LKTAELILLFWSGVQMRPRAIVFENDEMNRTVFRRILEHGGFEVFEAPTCDAAVGYSVHEPETPLLLLAAVIGSGPCSGVEVAARVLAQRPDTRMILTSASPMEAWPVRIRLPLADLPPSTYIYLAKPFTCGALLNAADRVLRRAESKPDLQPT
jgi:DNA-binding response OmpR family regulator